MNLTEPGIGRLPSEYVDYSRISDEFARDPDMPARATRVGLFVLSHREGFNLTQKAIAKRLKMNVGTVRAALEDLRELGYMRSWTVRDGNGYVAGTRYVVDDHKHTAEAWEGHLTSLNTKSDVRRDRHLDLSSDSEHRDSQHRESEPHKGDQFNQGYQDNPGPSSSTSADALPDPESPPADQRDDVERLCMRLRGHVIANGGKPPTITAAWRRDARLLLDKDGREFDKALGLIDWCQSDPFWCSNIMSMGKFRKQYDQLRLKANAEWQQRREQRGGESITGRALSATEAAFAEHDARHNGHHQAAALTTALGSHR